jgi:hypothetical protein
MGRGQSEYSAFEIVSLCYLLIGSFIADFRALEVFS